MGCKYDTTNLFSKTYNYDAWFENEELTDKEESTDGKESVELSYMPPLEGDEEAKQGKKSNILTQNKLLPRLPILLAQMKAGNNSCKLRNEIGQMLYLLYQHNKITKKVYNNSIKSL